MRGRAAMLGMLLLVASCSRSSDSAPTVSPPATGAAASVTAVPTSSATAPPATPGTPAGPPATAPPAGQGPALLAGRADIGGYSLAYRCMGKGSPTVLLEAGYATSGIATYGTAIQPALARTTRVCTYDRAGIGTSDARPANVTPVTAGTQAAELHALLAAIHVGRPYVVVGHAYGGLVTRAFAAHYPKEVVGMVLLDALGGPEFAVYDRLNAGAWVDGSVASAPNQTVDTEATVRELRRAPGLGATPLIVITAGVLEDRWLATEPVVAARAQTRLAKLSADSIHVLDRNQGRFLPQTDPTTVVVAVRAVLDAVKARTSLPPCEQVFAAVKTAKCLERGQLGVQQLKPAA